MIKTILPEELFKSYKLIIENVNVYRFTTNNEEILPYDYCVAVNEKMFSFLRKYEDVINAKLYIHTISDEVNRISSDIYNITSCMNEVNSFLGSTFSHFPSSYNNISNCLTTLPIEVTENSNLIFVNHDMYNEYVASMDNCGIFRLQNTEFNIDIFTNDKKIYSEYRMIF